MTPTDDAAKASPPNAEEVLAFIRFVLGIKLPPWQEKAVRGFFQ